MDERKSCGCESYKFSNVSNEMVSLVNQLNQFCIDRLSKRPNVSNKKGMSISIESPTCCPGYAQYNIDRNVPVRQYFGQSTMVKNSGMITRRRIYGVGTGSSTVGGDIKTTSTSPLTPVMKQIISHLNGMVFCKGIYCSKNVQFNHVTILYYMVDSHKKTVVNLNKHCDLVVSPSNVVGVESNSQKTGTPTVVLTLQSSKKLDFYKRYSDGKSFLKPVIRQGSMELNHGDIFVLHPRDERCIKRNILCPYSNKIIKEDKASQFQHGVSFKIDETLRNHPKCHSKLSISICFRQVKSELEFHHSFHDRSYYDCVISNKSQAMVQRSKVINKKRKNLSNSYNMNRINKQLKSFHTIGKKKL